MRSIQEALKETTLNTTMGFSVPEVIRTYNCSVCGSPVRVMRAVIKGQERIIDRCLECENRQMAHEAKENRKRAIARRMQEIFNEESLINESLKNACFENYHPKTELQLKAKQVAMQYVQYFSTDKPSNLLFSGPYGVGKSHLAVAIVKELMKKGHSCIFISVPRLFTKIKSTFGRKDGLTEDQIMQSLVQVDCLVLDDIGAEHIEVDRDGKGTGWGVSKIFEIVDGRSGKHTVYTTNLTGRQMETRFGERNISKLMQYTITQRVDGEDYRRRAFKEA